MRDIPAIPIESFHLVRGTSGFIKCCDSKYEKAKAEENTKRRNDKNGHVMSLVVGLEYGGV